MPWDKPEDAKRHTHLADSPHRQRLWLNVANSEMKSSGDDALAIESANAAVKRDHEGGNHKPKSDHWSGVK
jgi:hypothetical protein